MCASQPSSYQAFQSLWSESWFCSSTPSICQSDDQREREKVRKLFTSSSDDTPLRRRNLTVLKSWKMRGGITKCQNHRGKNVRGFWPFLTYCHDIEDISLLRRLESWMKVDRAKFRKVLMLFVCEVWRSKLSEVQREMLSLQARIKVGFGHSWVVEPSKLI